MISIVDICGMCGLDRDQIDAIAEHEHVPEVAAAALGHYLIEHMHHGPEKIRDMIVDDLCSALRRDDRHHAAELLMALRHFYHAHPEVRHMPARARDTSEVGDPEAGSDLP
jgi:hypothetical protein